MQLRVSTCRYVLLITVVSTINGNYGHHEMSNYRSQRTPEIPRNTRLGKPIAGILVGQRAFVNNNGFGNNRRDGVLLDEIRGEEDHLFKDPGSSRNKYVRQNRAIESTVQNVIDRDFIRGNSKDYPNPSNGFVPYPQEDRFPSASFQSEETANWNSGFEDQKDYVHESEDEGLKLEEFLDELSRQRVHGVLEDSRTGTRSRQGRRRKLTSQEQGILLVEALRKKRNFTSYANDHRGHGSDIQSGIMDMLGKSTL